MGTIKVQIRAAYGMNRAYPMNAEAKALARLAGSKTLTASALKCAESLGFTIEAVVLTFDTAQMVTASKLAEVIE